MKSREAFEDWIRMRSRGCLEPEEIDTILGELDGEYTNQSVQSQWESWQAANRFRKRHKWDVSQIEYPAAGVDEFLLEVGYPDWKERVLYVAAKVKSHDGLRIDEFQLGLHPFNKLAKASNETCSWSERGELYFESACGEGFFMEEEPKEGSVITWAFCPSCGRKLKEVSRE